MIEEYGFFISSSHGPEVLPGGWISPGSESAGSPPGGRSAVKKATLTRKSLILAVSILTVIAVLLNADGSWAGDSEPYFSDMGQLKYAKFLSNDGKYELAARELDRAIESFPASPLLADVQFRKAEAYLKAGRYRDAERSLRLFIENFKDSPLRGEAGRMILEARRLHKASIASPRHRQTLKIPPEKSPAGMNAVQVSVFDGLDLVGVASEFELLKASGVDTVIIRVFHNRGDRFYALADGTRDPYLDSGVYFQTTHAPVISDLLTPLVKTAHKAGLNIFAWMTTRYADYGLEDRVDLACRGFDLFSEEEVRCRGLDLFNEKAIRHLEALYSDLAEYDIDGILFQDDLVLRHTEGFGRHATRLFRKESGLTADPASLYIAADDNGSVNYTRLFWKWASWKNERLLAVADSLMAAVKQKRPGVRFAINLMYESVTDPPNALAWLSQDLSKAVKQGFDYYSIMAYHRQMGSELGKDDRFIRGLIELMAAEAARVVGEPEKVLMKVQTIDWDTGEPLSNGEVVSLIKGIRAVGGVSLAVVPYRSDFPFYELSGKGGYALLD